MALFTKLAALAATATLMGTTAFAQGYPDRQITMVVPFAAGGPTDTVGRLIAEKMSADLGQQVIVENVGGAGGTLATPSCCTILAWRHQPPFTAIWPINRWKPLNMWGW
jgi:tripartite-type tricarboxylate transporter receptor subunit TctC